MAVAGEAKVEAECAQVLVCSEQVQCARQPEMQLVAIERETLHLLECLRQIDGRAADLGGHLGERPAPREVGCEHELGAVDETPACEAPSRGPGAARAEPPPHERQRDALRFERLGGTRVQAVPEERNQCLRARIDPQPLHAKLKIRAVLEQGGRRELTERRFVNHQVEARIAAGHRMADAVAFEGVEEEHLIRLGHRLIAPEMSHEGTAIGENEVRRARVLFRIGVSMTARAAHVLDRDAGSRQKRLNGKFRHASSTRASITGPRQPAAWRQDRAFSS